MNTREKRLITVVVILLILVGVYYLAYRPMTQTQKTLEAEITTLEAELAEIEVDYVKMAEYEAGIEQAEMDILSILEKYPAGLSQEAGFKFLFDVEETFENIRFTDLTFTPISTMAYSDENNDENTVHSISQVMSSSLSVSYIDLKDFLSFVGDYKDRSVLTNLTMNYIEEEDMVDITVTLNEYAIAGGGREYITPEFDEVPVGKAQVFDSPIAKITETKDVRVDRPTDENADIFIRLKPTVSDIDAQIIGLVGDDDQSTYVKSDKNAVVEGVLRISVEGGQYFVNYDTDGEYKTNIPFEKGNAIEIKVNSSARVNEDDKSAMNLTIVNETEETVYITKKNEDPEAPRLIITSIEGDVVVED